MPGVISALPSGDGFDFTAISAAVGIVILGNSGAGLLNNIAFQGTLVVAWPAKPIWITPPHEHMHFDVLFKAGCPPIMQVGEPGTHGAVTGTHGIGVNTPNAAAVAEATVGFAIDEHMPKVGMFVIGIQSAMVAAGAPTIVLLAGNTTRAEGATPKEHVIAAPAVTSCGIMIIGLRVFRVWVARCSCNVWSC